MISSESKSNDSSLERFHHCFSTILRVELMIDVRDMVAERAHADLKLRSQLSGRFAGGQETENLRLL
jgi:hypothetical protein